MSWSSAFGCVEQGGGSVGLGNRVSKSGYVWGKALNRYGYTVTQERGRSRKNITQFVMKGKDEQERAKSKKEQATRCKEPVKIST